MCRENCINKERQPSFFIRSLCQRGKTMRAAKLWPTKAGPVLWGQGSQSRQYLTLDVVLTLSQHLVSLPYFTLPFFFYIKKFLSRSLSQFFFFKKKSGPRDLSHPSLSNLDIVIRAKGQTMISFVRFSFKIAMVH